MKKVIIFAAMAVVLCACGNRGGKKDAAENADVKQEVIMEKTASLPAEPVFDIVTSLGTIRIKLYEDTPKHRDNFCKLALSGYFNGMLFHRVINGFMIQGGDPLSKEESMKDRWGTGGPGYTVKAEILPNHTHKKGALAAARRGDAANPMRESSGSQFYLVQDPVACSQLDGQYTVYGETIEGLEIIDKIASVPTDYRDRPETAVKIVTVKLVEN